jgi:hypothetical protein
MPSDRRRWLSVTIGAICALALAACGHAAHAPAATGPLPPVLSRTAVPELPQSEHRLAAQALVANTGLRKLGSLLAGWGYVTGAARNFQGGGPTLNLVVSQTLDFTASAGASAFSAFVHDHAGEAFGSPVTIRALSSHGRVGWRYQPASCGCHRSNPSLYAVVVRGNRVSWLEINGPLASPAMLARLLAQSP